jgi:hypothetical protein
MFRCFDAFQSSVIIDLHEYDFLVACYSIVVSWNMRVLGVGICNCKSNLNLEDRYDWDLQYWEALAELVGDVMKDFPTLSLTHGRKVLEVRPSIEWDKGKAVDFLLNSLGEELHQNC